MENHQYSRRLDELADLLEIQGDNPYRIRAYRNAARLIETMARPVDELAAAGPARLRELPGIGPDLARKLVELHHTGGLAMLETLRRDVPPSLIQLTRISGLGPKRAMRLWRALGVATIDQLEEAARSGRILEVPGMGPATRAAVLEDVAAHRRRSERRLLSEADAQARSFLDHLRPAAGIVEIEAACSLRRRRDTVGDLDLVASSTSPPEAVDRFLAHAAIAERRERSASAASVRLGSGLAVHFRVVRPEAYGAALLVWTGSGAHVEDVRAEAVRRGLRLDETGVWRGEERIGAVTEAEAYAAIGLPWIPPEIREGSGEVEAALEGRLPELVTLADVRGDLQMHTRLSDGKETLETMVRACASRGYEYMAVTDHGPALRMAGASPAEFVAQYEAIDRLQAEHSSIRILKSAEVDVLADGTLDLPDDLLARMDLVVVSIHSHFRMPADAMTRRLVRALRHPRVHVLAHPTGRVLGRREPYAFDLDRVLAVAREEGVFLEINAQPDRLDLSDVHARRAAAAGVRVAISTDAHRLRELDFMARGVDQARRGWIEAGDVANARPLEEFLSGLRAVRSPGPRR